MGWFQLDPPSIAARMRSAHVARPQSSAAGSVVRGALGFAVVSIAGFAPWALLGSRLYPYFGEAGLYAVCALVFVALAGLLLHGLILGPGSLRRFYLLFTPAFALYAAIWMSCWFGLGGTIGENLGLLGGTAAMAALFALAFEAPAAWAPSAAAMFILNAAGYRAGAAVESNLSIHPRTLAMLLWGVCYGLGLGAGLGLAFYLCQSKARVLLRDGDIAASSR